MREQVLIHLTKPYRKVTFPFLAKELNMTIEDMEMLVVDMILEKRLDAQIDQINGFVEMGEMNVKSHLKARKMEALVKWADAIENYRESFYQKLSV